MKILISDRRDPAFHLALEEVLFMEGDFETLLFIYRNGPAVVFGKHQIPWREADLAVAQAEGVPVLRRISGGGCVVHDKGNINYSLIQKGLPSKSVDFTKMYAPVLEGLRKLGLDVTTSDRNDFRIQGKKISGSAQYMRRDTTLFHGTLLVDSDLDRIRRLLKRDQAVDFESFASKSVPSPIVNLSEVMDGFVSTDDFLFQWVKAIETCGDFHAFDCPPDLIDKAQVLARDKYGSWEWNRGGTPLFTAKWESNEIQAKNGRFIDLPDCFDQSWVGKEVPEDLLRWFKEENIC
jgi:lipoate-protein ligase A